MKIRDMLALAICSLSVAGTSLLLSNKNPIVVTEAAAKQYTLTVTFSKYQSVNKWQKISIKSSANNDIEFKVLKYDGTCTIRNSIKFAKIDNIKVTFGTNSNDCRYYFYYGSEPYTTSSTLDKVFPVVSAGGTISTPGYNYNYFYLSQDKSWCQITKIAITYTC